MLKKFSSLFVFWLIVAFLFNIVIAYVADFSWGTYVFVALVAFALAIITTLFVNVLNRLDYQQKQIDELKAKLEGETKTDIEAEKAAE